MEMQGIIYKAKNAMRLLKRAVINYYIFSTMLIAAFILQPQQQEKAFSCSTKTFFHEVSIYISVQSFYCMNFVLMFCMIEM